MIKKSKIISLGIVLVFCTIFCWNVSAQSGVEYDLEYYNYDENGENVSDYVKAIGIFKNLSSKTIKDLNVVFTVMDADGIPLGQPYMKNPEPIESDGLMQIFIDFNDLAEMYGCEIGYVDFMYISDIEYDDGTTWSDPQGLQYFMSKAGF